MTRVSTTAKDAVFLVDGKVLGAAAVFTWPAGSKHTLEIAPWQFETSQARTRYAFQRWSSSSGVLGSPSNVVTITADPGVAWYNADLTTEYAVSLVFFSCSDGPCASPGTVWVNQVAYRQDANVWLAASSTVVLEATPSPGYVFAGWQNAGTQAPIFTMVLNGGTTVYPRFAVARPVQLLTMPDGLNLLADRAPVTAPVTLEWGWNTTHTLGAESPVWDRQGRSWMLRSWSDGAAANRTYEVPPGASPVTLVAQFAPAVAVALLTEPIGLTLTVDNADGGSPRYFVWAPGDQHTVAAPQRATDAKGGVWAFLHWSTGGPAVQTIKVAEAQAESGIRLTATYDPLSRIRVESVPSGLALAVDGVDCRTPCDLERPVGSTVHLSAPPSFGVADGVRLDFASWEGVEGPTFTTAAGYRKLTAHYQTSYRLALSTAPAGAGSWRLLPANGDGFYPAGASLSIGIEAASGMKFRGWGQDMSGSANPQSLVMDAPHSVQGLFDKLPAQPPAPRVGNSAGDTPADAVAPGSIASLFGAGLSDSTITGDSNPLPQTLAGVTLVCSGRLLPLLYVSPQQINFQVPGDLKPGSYQLELHRNNSPVIQVELNLARNAPGLLVAAHHDGSPVTVDSPASPGESILLYGTGLGPFAPMTLDGFRVPAAPIFQLADSVEVLIGGQSTSPDSAMAAAGAVGVAVLQVRIPQYLDNTAPAELEVQAGGARSNTMLLPIK